ncbi:MAG: hypothetical protein QNK37_26405 [Acidobacteriota bacterium]|nr:hypothetical protein [Acidobacteriota bacterium]
MFYRLAAAALVLTSGLFAQAQEASTEEDSKYKVKIKNIWETRGDMVHTRNTPESEADLSAMNLVDLAGNKVTAEPGKVTVIEYWSVKSAPTNLYWSRARALEHEYADEEGFQLLSINYDYVQSGKGQRKAVKEFLKDYTMPKLVLIDNDDGLRDIFQMRGPISYLLINHRGVYTYTFRGDDPGAAEFFDHVKNAVEFMRQDKINKIEP